MNSDFPERLVELCKQGTLGVEYIRRWLARRNKDGKLNNLDYIECLHALNEYDKHYKT